MLELSSEDALRLNVLAAQSQAVRIDEGKLLVYGLNGEREMKVKISPTGRVDPYLKRVRELLSGVALDSPGGYPVFLKRWTRMSQVDHQRLAQLLRLGEPEAVMAVACSPGLDDELARRVWWCQPDAEVARRMLEREAVAGGKMGPVLARFLLEFLPFEADPFDMVNSVRLILQPGLLDEEEAERLWSGGKRKSGYRVGFLVTRPDDLPERRPPHGAFATLKAELGPLASELPLAALLLKSFDATGQSFLAAVQDVLGRLTHQDVSSALMNAVGDYFRAARLPGGACADIDAVAARVVAEMARPEPGSPLERLLAALPARREALAALLFLGQIDEHVLTPIFSRTDAIGTVLRSKLRPVSDPLAAQVSSLLDAGTVG